MLSQLDQLNIFVAWINGLSLFLNFNPVTLSLTWFLCGLTEELGRFLKARLHRGFLSQQLNAIFVAPKLQRQNRTCKPAAISVRF